MPKKVLTLYLISALLGLMTGLLASLFQLGIYGMEVFLLRFYQFLGSMKIPITLTSSLTTVLLVLIAWLLVRYIAPEAAGSGVPEIEGALMHLRPIHWRRLLPVKFISASFALSGQMLLGREGPTIQMGANLAAMLSERLKLNQRRMDALIASGAAAGLAAAFNAPLAGILFILEELRQHFKYSFTAFNMVIISCVFASIALHCIIGPQAAIPMQVFAAPNLSTLWLFLLLGLITGSAALFFNKALIATLKGVRVLKTKHQIIFISILAGLIGYLAQKCPEVVGGGYLIIEQTLSLSKHFAFLILMLLSRFVLTLLSYATAVAGGIFAPLLALGTLLGLIIYKLFTLLGIDQALPAGLFALAGMSSLFAAALRCPITALVLIVEMTQNYALILPLMLSCLASSTLMQLAKNKPIYTQLLTLTPPKHSSLKQQ